MRKYKNVEIEKLKPYEKNARTHSNEQILKIIKSIEEFGFVNPVLIDGDFGIIAGHGRILAAKEMNLKEVPCLFIEDLTKAQKRAYIIADNKLALDAGWDEELLKLELEDLKSLDFDISLTGFDLEDFNFDDNMLSDEGHPGAINEKYLIAPFSVFYADSPRWIERKKFLTNHLKIESDKGRENVVTYAISPDKYRKNIKGEENNTTSTFDPVLCEILYNWFCKKNGKILDPFAGGSVRGILAGIYDFEYFGVDLSEVQIKENKKQLKNLQDQNFEITPPVWIKGDSKNIDKFLVDKKFDLMFSCPPYADLEVYSDDPNDLSNMDYKKFLESYCEIIKKCYDLLEDDTFAIWVVGEIRDKKSKNSEYKNFVPNTIKAFRDAGFLYYNEIIYVSPNGSLPLRIERQFTKSRKIGKKHQNILIFCKGDPIKTVQKLGAPEFLKPENDNEF